MLRVEDAATSVPLTARPRGHGYLMKQLVPNLFDHTRDLVGWLKSDVRGLQSVFVERKRRVSILPTCSQVETLPEPVQELADAHAALHIQRNVNTLIPGCFSDAVEIEVDTRRPDRDRDSVLVLLQVEPATGRDPAAAVLGEDSRDSYSGSRRCFVLFVERKNTSYRPFQAAANGWAANRDWREKPLAFILGFPDLTTRLQSLLGLFRRAGLPVAPCGDMRSWLGSHVAVVSPLANAIYLAGGNLRALAANSTAIGLALDAIWEGFSVIRRAGLRIVPARFRILETLPRSVLLRFLRSWVGTSHFEDVACGHALAAHDEMLCLGREFHDLARQSGIPTPSIDRLREACEAFEPESGRQPA